MVQHEHNHVDAPGNQPARPDWAALYQRHRETMLRVSAGLLRQASRDTDQAQDIVNQVFVEVMNNPPDPPGNWEAYLVKATAYRTKDHMTTAEARRAVPAPARGTTDRFSWTAPPTPTWRNRRSARCAPNSYATGSGRFLPGCPTTRGEWYGSGCSTGWATWRSRRCWA